MEKTKKETPNINDKNHYGTYQDLMSLINELERFYDHRGRKFFDLIEDEEERIKLQDQIFDLKENLKDNYEEMEGGE
tara:strand:+ start:63 stop:293 length:231 start_codon:yes stop_codon:yes gene_type:complete